LPHIELFDFACKSYASYQNRLKDVMLKLINNQVFLLVGSDLGGQEGMLADIKI
jgi:hypothetical protein